MIGSPTVATFTVTSVMSADPCLRVAPLAPVLTASTCADGQVTASVLRPSGPPEVLYSFAPPGTVGEGGARGAWTFAPSVTSVTVTATLRSPNINGWSALSGGWEPVEGDATRVTLVVPLVAGTCEATTPVVTVEPPQCVAGVASLLTVTPETVDGVTYEPAEAFDVELGATASVTATLDPAGVAWAAPEDMPGWVIGSPTVATFTVTSVMSADPCLRVAPLAPVLTASTCADGQVTASVLRPSGPPEVLYSFAPPGTVGEGGARGRGRSPRR